MMTVDFNPLNFSPVKNAVGKTDQVIVFAYHFLYFCFADAAPGNRVRIKEFASDFASVLFDTLNNRFGIPGIDQVFFLIF